MSKFFFILFISVISYKGFSYAIPPLEREVNLSLKNEKLGIVFLKIQEQTGLIFSYSSDLIINSAPITLIIKQKTVREVLSIILPNNITYKSKINYIILKEKNLNKTSHTIKVNGYIYDQTTDKKLANATIYDKTSLQSVTTNDYGYYSITIPSKNSFISINKENYIDTVIKLTPQVSDIFTTINLNPIENSKLKNDSSSWKTRLALIRNSPSRFMKNLKGYVNTINIKDSIYRNFQISLIPFIGTNHKLSGNVINKTSINILGGYSRGIKGFEFGSLFNINEYNMQGVQLGGLLNMVGDSSKGFQMGGLINIVGQKTKGFQASGIMNLNKGNAIGVQFGGLINYTKGNANGVQTAGIINLNEKNSKGFLFGGLFNITKDTMHGIALASLINKNNFSHKSFEIAGLINITQSKHQGTQIAGLFNYSKYTSGFQIAPFNYSDSTSNIPVGILSFVKKGVHQLEISSDEVFYTNISFRTGVYKFYNIVNIGFAPTNFNTPLWTIGYGIGTSFKINEKYRSDITLSINHINKGELIFINSENYKIYWGIEKMLKHKATISIGPTFNIYVVDNTLPNYLSNYDHIAPYSIFKFTSNHSTISEWIGLKISLRFF